MFLRDSNGFLINTDRIIKINIEMNEVFCAVKAHYLNEYNSPNKVTLYKDTELQYCQEYLSDLSRKIAVNHEIWEN